MARQIGYGALTVTDVTDGINNATVYLYHRFASVTGHTPPANNKLTYNFTTGKITGATADFNGWSQTIPNGTDPLYVVTALATSIENTYLIPSWSDETKLVVNGEDGQDGVDGTSITAVKEVYYFTTGAAPAQSTLTNGTAITSTSTGSNVWTTAVPAYSAGGHYYTSLQTSLSKGTSPVFSTISLNQALTDANNNATIAKSIAQANEENAQGALAISQGLESKLRYIWINLNEPSSLPSDDTLITNDNYYLAGTYAASGINGTTFSESKTSTYGWNSLLRHNKLMFRYNGIALTTIGTDGLKLFAPIVSNGIVTGHRLGTEVTATEMNIYNPASQKVGMKLNSSGLTFYKYNSTTAAATLNGTGLEIAAGSINLGSGNFIAASDGTITAKKGTIGGWTLGSTFLSTSASGTPGSGIITLSKGIAGPTSATGVLPASKTWAFTASNKFGVTTAGDLYATDATITGAITATSLKIGNDTTSVTTSAILNTNVQSQNFSEGTMLYKDPTFASGVNGTTLYDNNKSGKTSWSRAAKSSDNPVSGTSYEMVCKNTATGPSPGLGGFYWSHASRANAIFLYRIIAKIPTEHNLQFASNATGNNPTREWLTPNAGTGQFKEYIFKQVCGSSGTFSSTGYFYIDGTAGISSAPITWYVAYATVYDMTAVAEVKNYITHVDSAGITIHPSGTTNDRILLNSNGLYIYKGGVEQAYFTGSAAAIGQTGKDRIIINSSGLHVYNMVNSTQTEVAVFGSTARVGIDGKQRIVITSNGITGYTSDNKGMLQLSPTWHCFGDPNSTRITMGLSGNPYVYMNAGGKAAFNVSAQADGSNTTLDLYGNNAIRVRIDKNGMTLYDGNGTANTNRLAVYSGGIYLYKPGTTTALVSITTDGASFNGTVTAGANSKIGPWTVSASAIYNGSTAINNTTTGVYLGTNGLNISAGSAATTITVSTTNFTKTINGTSRTNLRMTIGSNFGMDSSGNIYANGANITSINAGNITAGTLAAARIAVTDIKIGAAQVTSGTFDSARIPNLAISKITSLQSSLDGKASTTAATNAAKTATSYLSYDSTNGLRIAQSTSSITANYIQITSSAVSIIKDSTHKAVINASGMSIYAGDASNAVASFGSSVMIGAKSWLHFTTSSNKMTYAVGDLNLVIIGEDTSSERFGYVQAILTTTGTGAKLTPSGVDVNSNCYFGSTTKVSNITVTSNATFSGVSTTTSSANARLGTSSPVGRLYRYSSSSQRYKHDIKNLNDEIIKASRLYNLDVKQFKYNKDYLTEEDIRFNKDIPGFIAEEVYEVYPIAADLDDNGKPEDWNVRYIVPPMLKLIQEQHEEIEQLKKEVEQLKNK